VSGRVLPHLDAKRLKQLEQFQNQDIAADSMLFKSDSVNQSFLKPTRFVGFKKDVHTFSGIKLSGNIVLFSDTTIIIDSTAILNNIMIFAKAISVKSGFHGNCQLFATDSIRVDSNCRFNYPSCLGILRFQDARVSTQARIYMGAKTNFSGLIFTYEQKESPLKPHIIISKNAKITGQIYSQGVLELGNKSEVAGSVFTSRFLYRTQFTLYENYLINTTINSKALSPYYLTSELIPVAKKKKKILQWIEAN